MNSYTDNIKPSDLLFYIKPEKSYNVGLFDFYGSSFIFLFIFSQNKINGKSHILKFQNIEQNFIISFLSASSNFKKLTKKQHDKIIAVF